MSDNLQTLKLYKSYGFFDRRRRSSFSALSNEGYLISNYNFKSNDGITTSIVINRLGEHLIDTTLNYLQVYTGDTLDSSWFILSFTKIRQDQYRLELKRDSIADFWSHIEGSTALIERGYASDDNPLLLNQESTISVNQIKKKEIKLFDDYHCGWVVLYKTKYKADSVHSWSKIKFGASIIGGDLTISTPIADYPIIKKLSGKRILNFQGGSSNVIKVQTRAYGSVLLASYNDYFNYDVIGSSVSQVRSETALPNANCLAFGDNDLVSANSRPQALSKIHSAVASAFGYDNYIKFANNALASTDYIMLTIQDFADIAKINGKLIVDSTGARNRVRINLSPSSSSTAQKVALTSSDSDSIVSAIRAKYNKNNMPQSASAGNSTAMSFNYIERFYTLQYAPEVLSRGSFDLTQDETAQTIDANFDCLAIPFGINDGPYFTFNGASDEPLTMENAISVATAIGTSMTKDVCLDIQVVPYVNVPNLSVSYIPSMGGSTEIAILNDSKVDDKLKFVVKDGDDQTSTSAKIVARGYWINRSVFSERIKGDYDAIFDDLVISIAKEKGISASKLDNCTKVYRLTSPNYNGSFEFSYAKNGYKRKIPYFDVDVALKPYAPYIHIAPEFHGLYGEDFNDARGLTCQGDFSIGMINDQWKTYELENKNYQNIFNRQIENMDVLQSYNRFNQIVGAVGGTIAGTGAGAYAGAKLGGPFGAIVGAGLGGVSSGVAGAIDVFNNQRIFEENRSYAIDSFNLQLGNIKALPYTLTKVSALTQNNKILPILEVYSASPEEMNYVAEYLSKNGYSLNVMDQIEEGENYIKGGALKAVVYQFKDSDIPENIKVDINDQLSKGIILAEENS